MDERERLLNKEKCPVCKDELGDHNSSRMKSCRTEGLKNGILERIYY